MTYYKCLDANNRPVYGSFVWSLPNGKPGDWTPERKQLVVCESGFHLARDEHVIDWLSPNIYVAEPHPVARILEADNKTVVSRCRLVAKVENWNETTARLFAADCAEAVLHIFERDYPNDDRPRKAIEATRAYARGEIGAAVRAAAWAAARAAARAAAGAAAWDAAQAAARDAAQTAAGVAAWAAEHDRARQTFYARWLQYVNGEITT